MKILIALLLIVIPNVLFGEVTVKVEGNANNRKVIYYENDKIIAKEIYDEDGNLIKKTGKIPDGVVKAYDDYGNLRAKAQYKNNKLNGTKKEYSETGALESESFFIDGKQEGIAKAYFDDGSLESFATWKNNKKEGVAKTYYPTGKLREEAYYENDKVIKQQRYTLFGDVDNSEYAPE